jgi:acetyl esterase/lipase
MRKQLNLVSAARWLGGRSLIVLLLITATALGQQHNDPSQSASSREIKRFLNLAYSDVGKSGACLTCLDIYAPPRASRLPIVAYLHGGSWARGDKQAVHSKPERFIQEGCLFISINYRLVPDVRYQEQAQDVANAVAWIRQHANEYGGDPQRLYLLGHSAGAHLAGLISTDERYLKTAGLRPDSLKGTVLLDGAGYDIPRQVNELGAASNRQMYREVFGPEAGVWRAASPITHVAKGKGTPPFLLIHIASRKDSAAQAHGLAAALRQAGIAAQVESAPNKTHESLTRDLGLPDDEPTGWILRFLRENGAAVKNLDSQQKVTRERKSS